MPGWRTGSMKRKMKTIRELEGYTPVRRKRRRKNNTGNNSSNN